jgi:RNA polymerase sigma-70 factor (sigma-E family)
VRDAEGFDEFYRGTRQRLLTYLYAAGGDLTDAQDAAQEAYARAWQHWADVGRYGDPEAWVRTVGWRILANRWRKLRGQFVAYRRYGVAATTPAPTEDTAALVAALRRLPADQRLAIVLHHIAGVPVEQVAEQTGVPVGTVKARLSRGRRSLALLLATKTTEDEHA